MIKFAKYQISDGPQQLPLNNKSNELKNCTFWFSVYCFVFLIANIYFDHFLWKWKIKFFGFQFSTMDFICKLLIIESVSFRTSAKSQAINSRSCLTRFAMIIQILPKEIMVLILKKLDYHSLSSAFKVCVEWRELIHGFDLFNLSNFGKFCSTT